MADPACSTPLNVIALISGGKDSIYSLLHCLANGHKVIALANLYPENGCSAATGFKHGSSRTNAQWDRDVDSFMYQTAGHNLIPLYADALGLPLYRQEITGDAQDSSLAYSGHEEDETEALVPLLQRVKVAHPEANAVSSGAILSTYQRTRIESIAIRLGLIPLAYLWQYPSLPPQSPSGLLEDMANAGFDVRIIKVASGGLDGTLLWSNLMDPLVRKRIEKAVSRFGGSVLGEGGEYETMVINGPSDTVAIKKSFDETVVSAAHPTSDLQNIDTFWQGRIEISQADMCNVKELGSGGSTSITFRNGSGKILRTSDNNKSDQFKLVQPTIMIPELWDRGFEEIRKPMAQLQGSCAGIGEAKSEPYTEISGRSAVFSDWQRKSDQTKHASEDLGPTSCQCHVTKPVLEASKDHDKLESIGLENSPHTYQVGNIRAVTNMTGLSNGSTASEQMWGISQRLLAILGAINRPTSSVVFITIILDSISDFAATNLMYGRLFSKPNPPARVTIAHALPAGLRLMVTVFISMCDRIDALHIQSRSYWAPANIGPYSQAVSMRLCSRTSPSLVFIAGQIPLVPATMEMLWPSPGDPESPSHTFPGWLDGFWTRSCLSLQHLWRIGQMMKVSWWTGAVAFIAGKDDPCAKATTAWNLWRNVHQPQLWEDRESENNDSVDVWEMRYGGLGSLKLGTDEKHALPDFSKVSFNKLSFPFVEECSLPSDEEEWDLQSRRFETAKVPGFFAIEVDDLPRGSNIEWQSLGIAHSDVRMMANTLDAGDCHLQAKSCMIPTTRTFVSYIDIPFASTSQQGLTQRRLLLCIDWLRNVSTLERDILITVYTPDMSHATDIGAQVVPCRGIWGSGGRRLSAGIVAILEIRDGMEFRPSENLP